MKTMRNCKPVFSKVLVRLIECDVSHEEVSESGIVLALNSINDIELKKQAMSYGYVIDVGPYVGYRRGVDVRCVPCKVGDKILFYRHAGTLIDDMKDGNWYRLIEDLDIEATFPEEGIEL